MTDDNIHRLIEQQEHLVGELQKQALGHAAFPDQAADYSVAVTRVIDKLATLKRMAGWTPPPDAFGNPTE